MLVNKNYNFICDNENYNLLNRFMLFRQVLRLWPQNLFLISKSCKRQKTNKNSCLFLVLEVSGPEWK